MKKILISLIIVLGMISCKKENTIKPVINGHKLTVVSNGQGERVVLSGRDFDFVSIKPQADTVVFENVSPGEYMVSVSRVRFLLEMGERDTTVVFNVANGN